MFYYFSIHKSCCDVSIFIISSSVPRFAFLKLSNNFFHFRYSVCSLSTWQSIFYHPTPIYHSIDGVYQFVGYPAAVAVDGGANYVLFDVDALSDPGTWVTLLAGCTTSYLAVSWMVFEYVLEE